MKVKIFESYSAENLEMQINDWLNNNRGIHIESIHYTTTDHQADYYKNINNYSALILYNENYKNLI